MLFYGWVTTWLLEIIHHDSPTITCLRSGLDFQYVFQQSGVSELDRHFKIVKQEANRNTLLLKRKTKELTRRNPADPKQ